MFRSAVITYSGPVYEEAEITVDSSSGITQRYDYTIFCDLHEDSAYTPTQKILK